MADDSKVTLPVEINLDEVIEAGTPEWQEAVDASGGLEVMQEKLSDSIATIINAVNEAITPVLLASNTFRAVAENITGITSSITGTIEGIEQAYKKALDDAIKERAFPDTYTRLTELAGGLSFFAAMVLDYFSYVEDLGEYLEQELGKPDYAGLIMSDMLKPLPDDPNNNLWIKATQAAEEAMRATDPERYQAMLDNRRRRQQGLDDDQEAAGETEERTMETLLAAIDPWASVPNGDSLNTLYRVLSTVGGRPKTSNRHEDIHLDVSKDGKKARVTKVNKQSGTVSVVEIDQAEKYLKKTNKAFLKLLFFTLQKMTAQNFPLVVGFSLQELVDLGMYANCDSARRATKDFFSKQKGITLSGSVKKGKRIIEETGGILFYHYKIQNNFVRLYINENFNMEFLAPYFTIFPRFAYSLSDNAFCLVRYIFFLARQNTRPIKEKGCFTISLSAINEVLGLPTVDEVKNWKYKQYIMTPIEAAIAEIKAATDGSPEVMTNSLELILHGTNTSNINEWLQGYLEIRLAGDFAKTFIKLATKAERDRNRWEQAKLAERARLAVKEEAKAAKKAAD